MKSRDLNKIIDILGTEGAKAGLKASRVTVRELRRLESQANLSSRKNATREEIIDFIIENQAKKIDISWSTLFSMSYEELLSFFKERDPSNAELENLIRELGYRLSSTDRKNVREFAARQISETSLFQHIARGDE